MSFGGIGRQILLHVDRTRVSVSQVLQCKANHLLAIASYLVCRHEWYWSPHLTFEKKSKCVFKNVKPFLQAVPFTIHWTTNAWGEHRMPLPSVTFSLGVSHLDRHVFDSYLICLPTPLPHSAWLAWRARKMACFWADPHLKSAAVQLSQVYAEGQIHRVQQLQPLIKLLKGATAFIKKRDITQCTTVSSFPPFVFHTPAARKAGN